MDWAGGGDLPSVDDLEVAAAAAAAALEVLAPCIQQQDGSSEEESDSDIEVSLGCKVMGLLCPRNPCPCLTNIFCKHVGASPLKGRYCQQTAEVQAKRSLSNLERIGSMQTPCRVDGSCTQPSSHICSQPAVLKGLPCSFDGPKLHVELKRTVNEPAASLICSVAVRTGVRSRGAGQGHQEDSDTQPEVCARWRVAHGCTCA